MKNKTAILLGASGLVGAHCLEFLLSDERYTSVKIFLRKDIPLEHPKLTKYIIDFSRVADFAAESACDDVFCCLGTTIRQAGSQMAFKRVDFELPLEFARMAKRNGAKQYLVISSIGASASSSSFYLRTKGELEAGLEKLHFERLVIVRPSMLLGERKHFRFGEAFGKVILFLLTPLIVVFFKKYMPVKAKNVALLMVKSASDTAPGTFIIESNNIR